MKIGDPILSVAGRGVPVPGDDIDTDRIIPARFMKVVTFDGLGEHAFADERRDEAGRSKGHPFDDPRFAGASVLVSGRNFGCGSSREHAPQALFRAGIRAVVAESFAEIFFGNCTTLGLVCLAVDAADRAAIAAAIEADPSVVLTLDVATGSVTVGGRTFAARMPSAARDALVSGDWDPLAILRARAGRVAEVAHALPYAAWSGLAVLFAALLLSGPAHAAKLTIRPAKADELKITERPLPSPALLYPEEGDERTLQLCRAERQGDALLGGFTVSGCDPATASGVSRILDAWPWPTTKKAQPVPVITVAVQRVGQKPTGSYDAIPVKHDVRATFRPTFGYPKDAWAAGEDATCIADLIVTPNGVTAFVAVWDCPEAFQAVVAPGLRTWEWTAKKAKAPIPVTLAVVFDAPDRDAEAEAAKAARKAAKKDVAKAGRPAKPAKASKKDAPPEPVAPAVIDDEPETLEPEPAEGEGDAPVVPEDEEPQAPAETAGPAVPAPAGGPEPSP